MPGEPSAPAPPPAVPKLPTTLPFEDEAARGRRQGCLKWGLVGCAGASVVLIVLLLYALSNMRQLMGTLLEKAGDEVVASATADVTQVEKERFRAALAAFSQKAQKGAVKPETIDEWRKDQQSDLYDEMNRGWMEILIKKKSFGEKEFPEIKNQMFFMVSTNTDYFRAFVFESSFLETYDLPPERIEKVRTDDTELLKLGYEWLRSAMFAEETLKIREGVAEARKDRTDAIMKKVYGNKEKGQIGEID